MTNKIQSDLNASIKKRILGIIQSDSGARTHESDWRTDFTKCVARILVTIDRESGSITESIGYDRELERIRKNEKAIRNYEIGVGEISWPFENLGRLDVTKRAEPYRTYYLARLDNLGDLVMWFMAKENPKYTYFLKESEFFKKEYEELNKLFQYEQL